MMKFNVTQRDIDLGSTGDAGKCAVARAIRRTLHVKESEVCVTSMAIEVRGRDYVAPSSVADFVPAFDDHQRVRPFSFSLPIRKRAKRVVKVGARLVVSQSEYAFASV